MTIVQREKKASGKISFELFKSTDEGDEHQTIKNQRASRLQGWKHVSYSPSPPLWAETYASISAAVSVHQIQLTNKDTNVTIRYTNMTIQYKYVQINLQSKDSS